MGLIERIRTGTYVPDLEPPLAAPGRRVSLRESAARVEGGEDILLVAREFLDQAGRVAADELEAMVAERPALTGVERADALMAALAEYAAARRGIACPVWAGEPERFLDRFWFVSDEPGFRGISLAQSPIALKRRGIMWPARSLQRM